jgi:ATP-dependent helicase/nuclease subunit B
VLRIVLGRAGSGKTEHCLREARAALRRGGPLGPPLILLAPEQATHQLERALLEPEADGRACTRLEVLSFARLAHRVLQAVGGLGRARLGAAGLRMLLRQALREHAGSLRAFAAGADRPGLAAALARQIAELQAYALSPEALRAAAAAAPPGTASRLHDVALLWEAEREALRALGLGDPGSDLAAAAAGLTEAGLQSAEVWVDGFAGFTGGEEAVLLGLLRAGCHLTVTLCLDPDDAPGADGEDPGHPFAPTRRTLRRLLRAGTAEVVRLPARGAPPRFPVGGDLARLEAGLWDGPAAAPPGGDGAVRFLAADDPAAEAEGAAAEIDRLVRLEGFRYREVAVIVRDLAAYRAPLEAACRARGIPVFVDLRRPAEGHPGPRVLRAALEVLASGWRLPAMRRYLHCDLCPLRRDQADALENLALARGLSGSDWYAPGTDLAPLAPPAPGAQHDRAGVAWARGRGAGAPCRAPFRGHRPRCL